MMEVPQVMTTNDRIHEEMEARATEEEEAVEEARVTMAAARSGSVCIRDSSETSGHARPRIRGHKQLRERKSGQGFGSTNAATLHFGLGTAKQVDRLVVRWPDGSTSEREKVEADQKIDIVQGDNPVPPPPATDPKEGEPKPSGP